MGVGDLDLRFLHGAGALGGEDPCPVRGATVVEVHPREGEDVPDGGVDQPHRPADPREHPDGGPLGGRAWLRGDVADRRPVEERFLGEGAGPRQAERREESLPHGCVPDPVRDDLDDAPEDRVPGVAVGHRGAEGVRLLEGGAGRDVALEAVVAASVVLEVVAVDAAGMGEEVSGGDGGAHVRVGDPEVGQVGPDRLVEGDETLVHEGHEDRRRPRLPHRADLEHGVGGDLHAGLEVDDARGRLGDVAVVEDPHGGAGDLVLATERLEAGAELLGVDGRRHQQ